MKVLAFVERRNGELKKNAAEIVTQARQLAGSAADTAIVALGGDDSDLGTLSSYGAGAAYSVDGDAMADYNVIHYRDAMAQAIDAFKPDVVLGIASPLGRDLFPRLAAKFDGSMLTDVVSLEESGGQLVGLKPYYSGKCLAKVAAKASSIQFATVRSNVIEPQAADGGASSYERLAFSGAASDALKLKEIKAGQSGKVDLAEADRIISGGRALGSADNFKILEECAQVLGASVGASRAAVDAGYAGHSMQVGQTGKTVNPSLYIACGISGSIQHMAGMRTSKVIVAINTDEDAPIFGVADYGIVGDLFEVVPVLTEKFKSVL